MRQRCASRFWMLPERLPRSPHCAIICYTRQLTFRPGVIGVRRTEASLSQHVYDPRTIEPKWQSYWEQNAVFRTPTAPEELRAKPKYYVLDMFPYPSGDGLHVGHPKGYTATDVVARAKRMMGFNVLRVMGWDSFGLPAERRAERTGEHPSVITAAQHRHVQEPAPEARPVLRLDARARDQRSRLLQVDAVDLPGACSSAASRTAPRSPVNFCPALGTVLANEEVNDGKYVETGDPVEKRLMQQWMLKITEYADRLLEDLDGLDWPRRHAQGAARLDRQVDRRERRVRGRRTAATRSRCSPRAPTRCSAAPTSCSRPSTRSSTQITDARAARGGRRSIASEVGKRSERDRTTEAADAPKTGVFTGAYRGQPGQRPGTSRSGSRTTCSRATAPARCWPCPAHDERDHAFAKKFGLPIVEVVERRRRRRRTRPRTPATAALSTATFLDGLDIDAAKRAR